MNTGRGFIAAVPLTCILNSYDQIQNIEAQELGSIRVTVIVITYYGN